MVRPNDSDASPENPTESAVTTTCFGMLTVLYREEVNKSWGNLEMNGIQLCVIYFKFNEIVTLEAKQLPLMQCIL